MAAPSPENRAFVNAYGRLTILSQTINQACTQLENLDGLYGLSKFAQRVIESEAEILQAVRDQIALAKIEMKARQDDMRSDV